MIALTAFLPFFVVPVSWATPAQSKVLLVSIAVLISTCAWAWSYYMRRSHALPNSRILFASALLPTVYLISALVSGHKGSSFVSGTGEQDTVVMMTLLFALITLTAVAYKNTSEAATAFIRAVVVGGLVLVLAQITHLIIPSFTLGVMNGSATSIFGSWHELGIACGLFVLLAVGLWNSRLLPSPWIYALRSLGAVSALLLFILDMQDVWYILGIVLLLFGCYKWLTSAREVHHDTRPHTHAIVLLAIGLILIVAGYEAAFIHDRMPARLQTVQTEVRPSWSGTFIVGRKVLANVRPLVFGSGPNSFAREWSINKPADVSATAFWNVDFNSGVGFIPTAIVTVGLLGLLSWLALLGALFSAATRFIGSLRQTPERPLLAVLFVGGLYLVAFHILNVPNTGLSALTFLLFGVLAVADPSPRRLITLQTLATWRSTVGTTAIGVLAIVFVGASVLSLRATVSDLLVNRSIAVYVASSNADHALRLIQNALLVSPNNDRGHRAAVQLGLFELQRLASSPTTDTATTARFSAILESTIRHGLSAVRIDSSDYQNWLSLAGLYQSMGGAGVVDGYKNATEAYQKAITANPADPQPHLRLAEIAFAQKHFTSAKKYADEAIALKPDLAAAYFLRSLAEARKNEYPAAVYDAEVAANIAHEEPLSWYNLGAILYAAGSYDLATQALERSVALLEDAQSLYMLGLSYDKLGRSQDALVALRKASQLRPNSETLAKIMLNLQTGKPAVVDATSTPAL